MTVNGPFFRKHILSQLFINNFHSKLYENLRTGLVTDIISQIDEWTETQSPNKAFFFIS